VIWLTWRQVRAEYFGFAVALMLLAAALVGTGIEMRGFEGGLACLSVTAAPSCAGQGDFVRAFGTLFDLSGWLNFVPLLLGIFIGAPLVAREIERGTHRLAWTQSVTRQRWILVKISGVVALAAVAGGVIAALMTWWRQPLDLIQSPFDAAGFDFEGLMPFAYTLFALSLGVLAGTLIRRTIPAMAVTLAGFLAVRLPIEFFLRPHFMTPIAKLDTGNGAPPGAWILDQGLIDRHGNQVFESQAFQLCGPSLVRGAKDAGTCLARYGIHPSVVYQPADRFWPFQLMETGIYAALSALLLTVAVVWIRRRMS
jgi:ABC-2 family transporter protein